jgi:hypothetical protein
VTLALSPAEAGIMIQVLPPQAGIQGHSDSGWHSESRPSLPAFKAIKVHRDLKATAGGRGRHSAAAPRQPIGFQENWLIVLIVTKQHNLC